MVQIQQLKIKNLRYPVKYEVSRSLSSSIRLKNGFIELKVSRFLKGHQREITIEKFLSWARKKLEKIENETFVPPVYQNGGRICTHNKIYEISVVFEDRNSVSSRLNEGHYIELFFPKSFLDEKEKADEKIKFLCEKIIMKDQELYLKDVLDELNQLYFQTEYNFCRFKRTKSRFGSCSSKKNINISYRLLFAPREVFRYVCAHELAHLIEFNHSKRFWRLVADAVPDYKKHEKWLKNSGFLLG